MMTEKILFVDDEVNVLRGFQRSFRNKFAFDTACSGDDGLDLVCSSGPYAVVISDMQMPQMNGLEFLVKVKEMAPDTVRIMLTGNADQKTAGDAVNQGQIFRFLAKPCSSESLVTTIDAGIKEYQRTRAERQHLEGAIGDVKDLSERLSFQQAHDPLTNLINRKEFEKRIQKKMQRVEDHIEAYTLCYLDLDQFRVINDSCGHLGGNELLLQVTRLLEKHIRKNDCLARLGGDEFGMLLDCCTIERALPIAERIRIDISNHLFSWDQKHFPISTSIGLVALNANTDNAEKMLSTAESACHFAKDSGRDRVYVSALDDKNLGKRQGELQWISRIHEALNENRFCLAFQTIAPISGKTMGKHYELLIRMKNIDGTLTAPGAFLPAAEKYNLSAKIDRWVISTAFRWLTDHPQQLEELTLCSINLSGLSLANQEFLEFVIAEFSQTNIPPEKICFEITETAAITDLPNAMKIIDRLKEYGCRFALDDFGSGLSSYAYLRNLRVDFLKIDGLFVKEIVNSEIDRVMVKCISEIGQVMGIQTVAEFVENDEILETLKEIGVDFAQGYGVAKPRPIEELIEACTETAVARPIDRD